MAAMISPMSCRSFVAWLSALALALGLAGLSGCAQKVLLPPVAKVEPPPVETPEPPAPEAPKIPAEVDSPRFARIAQVANQEIAAGNTPGAVILVGNQGRVVYKKGFGLRTSVPHPQPMTTDTVFDLASMTKVVATTTAVMQLVDAGRLRLDDPAAKYWPEFAANGKGGITIRQLMMHTSGLRADVNFQWRVGLRRSDGGHRRRPPRPSAGDLVQLQRRQFHFPGHHRAPGLGPDALDVYCAQHIFGPMGLKDTSFRPRSALQLRIAPCDITVRPGAGSHRLSHGRGGRECRGLCHGRRPGGLRPDDPRWRQVPGPEDSQPRGGGGHDQGPGRAGQFHPPRPGLGYPFALIAASSTPPSPPVPSGTPAIPAPPSGSSRAPRPT